MRRDFVPRLSLFSKVSYLNCASGIKGRRLTVAILVGQRTSSTEPGGLALLAGDASGDSWFREIHVPQAWRVYLATGLDFREKNRASFESIGTRLWLQSPTLLSKAEHFSLIVLLLVSSSKPETGVSVGDRK